MDTINIHNENPPQNQSTKSCFPTISHTRIPYRLWELMTLVMRMYVVFHATFEVAFFWGKNQDFHDVLADCVINVLFIVDIWVNLCLTYYDDDGREIKSRYMTNWCVPDMIVVVLEFGRLGLILIGEEGMWCLNLAWFYRLVGLYMQFGRSLLLSTTYEKYISALYWSITTFSTTGYGDVHAVNSTEKLISLVYILGCLVVTAYVIGNISILMLHATTKTNEHRHIYTEVSSFAQKNHLSIDIQRRIEDHIDLGFARKLDIYHELGNLIPKSLLSQVSYQLFYTYLEKLYFLEDVSTAFMSQLVMEIKTESFKGLQDVVLESQASTDLYIIVSGVVNLIKVTDGVEEVMTKLNSGDVFGEIGVICNIAQPYAFRTEETSHVLRISKTSFIDVLKGNLGDGSMIMCNLFKHFGHDESMIRILRETKTKIDYGLLDFPQSLPFATLVQNEKLVRKLLMQGANINEVDAQGRTAMFIATSFGNVEIVKFLITNGMVDPYAGDLRTNCVLWESIKTDNQDIRKLLVEHGVTLANNPHIEDFIQYANGKERIDWVDQIHACGEIV